MTGAISTSRWSVTLMRTPPGPLSVVGLGLGLGLGLGRLVRRPRCLPQPRARPGLGLGVGRASVEVAASGAHFRRGATTFAPLPRVGPARKASSAPCGEDDVVAAQHVVGVQLVGDQQVHAHRRCAGSSSPTTSVALEDDQDVAAIGDRAQRWPRPPCDEGSVAVDHRADHVHTAVAGPVGQGAAQGGGLHLLGRALLVVARRRAVHHATAGELRSAGRALTGAAGALLLVRLAATAADLAAALGVVRALPGGSQLRRRPPGGSAAR